jgi:SlyX protein
MNDVTQDVIDLQTRIVFQEDTLQQLNAVVAQQDQEIRELQQQLKLLAKRFDDALYAQEQGGTAVVNERPPHY